MWVVECVYEDHCVQRSLEVRRGHLGPWTWSYPAAAGAQMLCEAAGVLNC